jgi:hypothetical protein
MSDGAAQSLSDAERAFAHRAVRRKHVFRTLSLVNVSAAALLAALYTYERMRDPSFAIMSHAVIVLLILLAARQNLRQYRYASILEKLIKPR